MLPTRRSRWMQMGGNYPVVERFRGDEPDRRVIVCWKRRLPWLRRRIGLGVETGVHRQRTPRSDERAGF